MASKALRGLTIEIGGDTTELNKALDKVDKRSRSLSSELGQINKALKLDPTNTELLAQKQKVLAEAISNTEDKLDTLKEAEKQVQKQFERGEVSQEQVRALRREIIETERKLDGYKNAAKETADATEELGKESGKAADELDEQAEKTKEAAEASEELDYSSGDLAKGGLTAVAAAATAAVTAIVALAEESREYRTEMAKLDTAFTDAGYSAETATETYEALQSVLGETEQAVEASNMLAKLCKNEEELNDWTEILTGVYGTFGASLPVEGLAEAANETMRVGQVTGPLADALNWAAEEGETFGVVLKENTKANEDWNKAVEEASSAEDYFNLALQECSTEQERQQLITETLTKLYGSAAKQYKETNKEVIRSNKATEKWNKATAKIGKTVEPVVTDIKELGTVLLEDASEPLEDIADFIRKKVLPAIKSAGNWVKQNGPTIKATLVGVTTAIVAFEAATIASTVAQKGLKGAIMATEVAQKALALAQAATPWGLIATAIAGVTAAMIVLSTTTRDAGKPVDVLTDEEKELAAAADEAAAAFRDQQAATQETMNGINAQMNHVGGLVTELQGLADATGKVHENDQARAQFIINELNNALGTEYEMVGGIIQQYDTLKNSIFEVIEQKKAKLLLEAAEADYVEAIKQKDAAYDTLMLKEKEYDAQKAQLLEKEKAYANEKQNLELLLQGARESGNSFAEGMYLLQLGRLDEEMAKEREAVEDKKLAWEDAALAYNQYSNNITNYEAAQTAALQGNYEEAVEILGRKGQTFGNYSKKVDTETAKVLDSLALEAAAAGHEAEETKRNFENGVEGYTQQMVDEAEENYKKAMSKFETAYADAEGVGEDMTDGLTKGAENKRQGLLAKARSLVSGFLSAARKEADSHSPSRKTMALGEDIGEGAEIGIENKTKDVEKAATKQVGAVLEAYNSQEVNAQRALRNVAEQQTARQTAGQMAVASSNSPMLEKILAAIEKGQVITLDGDALVGATANKMDNALGRRRALASRGAI